MFSENINKFLAGDDKADCLLFKDVLEELSVNASNSVIIHVKK